MPDTGARRTQQVLMSSNVERMVNELLNETKGHSMDFGSAMAAIQCNEGAKADRDTILTSMRPRPIGK